jgi:hypothetical protein
MRKHCQRAGSPRKVAMKQVSIPVEWQSIADEHRTHLVREEQIGNVPCVHDGSVFNRGVTVAIQKHQAVHGPFEMRVRKRCVSRCGRRTRFHRRRRGLTFWN